MKPIGIAVAAASLLAIAACSGQDCVAEGTPVYDNGKIVRWTKAGECFSADVKKGQPYVTGGRVEIH